MKVFRKIAKLWHRLLGRIQYRKIHIRLISDKGEMALLMSVHKGFTALTVEQATRVRDLLNEGIKEMNWRLFLHNRKDVSDYLQQNPEDNKGFKIYAGFGESSDNWQENVRRKIDGEVIEDLE